MRRRFVPASLIVVACLLAGLGAPAPAAAGIGITTKATQTYELRPAEHLVHVTIDMTVKNTTPSFTTYEACIQYYWDPYWGYTPYSTTCPRTTNYYINDSYLWVEDGAQNLRISADAGSVSKSVDSHTAGFTDYHLKFQRIFYGKTRKIHATYDLPSSAPRTYGSVRAGKAYASFCVSGNGPDGGQIKVITPAEFDVTHSESTGLTFAESSANGKVTWSSGSIANPIGEWACFDGVNLNGFTRQSVQTSDGRSVIVAGWPEDPEWSAAVEKDVRTSLPSLEALVGRTLPGTGNIEIREVSSGNLGDYAGYFNPETNVAVVGEHYEQGGLVAHELSHAWFNDTNFKETWLSEGFAGWVESQNGGDACAHLPTYPGFGKPDLETWKYLGPKSTDQDRSVVTYQYDAACWLVADAARRVGPEQMTVVIGSLLDGTSAYGSTTAKATPLATWRTWLDAVDELGLVPAGESDLDLLQSELADAGVATDDATLGQRSAARAAYHALIDDAVGWDVPEAILAPLTTWTFTAADGAIAAAQRGYESAAAAEAAVPESLALTGPIKTKWEAAQTSADLDAVAALAGQEADAAVALVAAQARADDTDPVSQIGLLGTDLAAMVQLSIDGLRNADPTAASLATAQLTAALDGASGAGWLRIGLAVGLLLAIALVILFVRRRRRSAAVPPQAFALEPAGSMASALEPALEPGLEPAPMFASAPAPEPALALEASRAPAAADPLPPMPAPAAADPLPPDVASPPPPVQTAKPAAERLGWLAGMVSDPESARAMLRRTSPSAAVAPRIDGEQSPT